MSGAVVVESFSRASRLALRSDGVLGDVVEFLDDEGDETEDAKAAAAALVQWRDGGFSPIYLRDFEAARPAH